ncbi:MAG: RHS repeat-associated core domain-containing protein, partial [Nitrososphaera sp.]|nr:RHS repeat-associated core domain-containing protein [Nitrososphaera sp.]
DPDGDGLSFVYNLRMPGQYFDQETGLHYNTFRDYDPRVGRYVESDPIGLEGGINPYIYVGSNPLSRIDPNGLEAISEMSRLNWGFGSSQNEACETCKCWLTCLRDDPLLPELLGGLGAPLLNLKRPGEMRLDASPWTSIDRRLPSWTGANPNAGATVTRGAVQRIKCVGRYGTLAAGVGAFTAGYAIGAAGRCWVECQE